MKSKPFENKKVLLRERKRHTARRVASPRYAALVGGVPLPGGYPCWGVSCWEVLLLGGTPARGGGTPTRGYPLLGEVPPIQSWEGVPPISWMGYPHIQTWEGGIPPPPRCEQTDTCENSTFPRTTYMGGNNCKHQRSSHTLASPISTQS